MSDRDDRMVMEKEKERKDTQYCFFMMRAMKNVNIENDLLLI